MSKKPTHLSKKKTPFQIDDHVGILIKKAARLFEQVANRNLEKLGVTYSQTIFLIRLWGNNGQNQMELAKSAGLKQPTVVRILDRMERDNLVKRSRNQDDRRIFNFYLTAKAEKICQELESHANNMNEIATKSMHKNDVEILNHLVSDVIENLQNSLSSLTSAPSR